MVAGSDWLGNGDGGTMLARKKAKKKIDISDFLYDLEDDNNPNNWII